MSYRAPARTTPRRISGIRVGGMLLAVAAIAASLFYQSREPSSSTAAPTTEELPSGPGVGPPSTAVSPIEVRPIQGRGALGEADGALPDHTTVFTSGLAGVDKLVPGLLGALRRAATAAAASGVDLYIDSGWRSPAYQERLLQEAVSKYGSEAEALRWVATPTTSSHVSGNAVDIGPFASTVWLSRHGASYGLCQIYRNEPWHYELRRESVDHRCPPMYADPTHDPRMKQ